MHNKDFFMKYGLIYGLVTICWLLISYLIGVNFMVSIPGVLLSFTVGFGILLYIGFESRKFYGGYQTFKQAFIAIYIAYAIGAILYTLFNYVLYTVIDPGLVQQTIDVTLEKTTGMLESLGVPESEMEEVYTEMEKQREEIADAFTFTGMIKSYFSTVVFGALLCALAALITRKNNPNPFEA
jgi:hypothetical protein